MTCDQYCIFLDILYLLSLGLIAFKVWPYRDNRSVSHSLSVFATVIAFGFFLLLTWKSYSVQEYKESAYFGALSLISFFLFSVAMGWWCSFPRSNGIYRNTIGPFAQEFYAFMRMPKRFFFSKKEKELFRDLLYRVAYLDNDFDKKEELFIVKQLRNFNIEPLEDTDIYVEDSQGKRFERAYTALTNYFSLSPSQNKVHFIHDMIHKLIRADSVVTREEVLFLDEVDRLSIKSYQRQDSPANFELYIVPQNQEQFDKVRTLFPSIEEKKIFNADAFFVGFFYTLNFAEQVANNYRDEGLPTFVVVETEKHFVSTNS